MRVLLIDDLAWLEESRKIIEGLGAEAAINIGPLGALFAARVFCPDVVFLDLDMSKLDGSWLFAELKKTVLRIYFCSDSEPGIFNQFARAVGVSGTISKT